MFQFDETEDSTFDRRASIALNESVQGRQKHRATRNDAEAVQEKRKKYFTRITREFFPFDGWVFTRSNWFLYAVLQLVHLL